MFLQIQEIKEVTQYQKRTQRAKKEVMHPRKKVQKVEDKEF
jgi:hypothetical protein